ncbi:MAG: hypothetical protein JJU28_17655 [Cyclobacteriaceae bacterium]|nr:hypothetical protein [Cyclobacteriaceae bacterium]
MHKLLIILLILVVLLGNVAITSQRESVVKNKENFIAEVAFSQSFEYKIIEEYLSRQESSDLEKDIKMVVLDQEFNIVLEGMADQKLSNKVRRDSELLFQTSGEHYYWQKR